jgi:hypothetical protein
LIVDHKKQATSHPPTSHQAWILSSTRITDCDVCYCSFTPFLHHSGYFEVKNQSSPYDTFMNIKGERIFRGQVLVSIGYMKIETFVVSPSDGLTENIHVAPSQTVETGVIPWHWRYIYIKKVLVAGKLEILNFSVFCFFNPKDNRT